MSRTGKQVGKKSMNINQARKQNQTKRDAYAIKPSGMCSAGNWMYGLYNGLHF